MAAAAAPPDYYAAFGFDAPVLALDSAELQARFYKLTRQFHPDRFARRPAAEQQAALDMTSMLNDGVRILRDPVKRAEYVLSRNGFEIGEQRSKDVPAELLEEVFELNMALEELRDGDAAAREGIVEARSKFETMRGEIDEDLAGKFAAHDRTPAAERREILASIRAILNRRRYIENLITEAARALDA